VCPVHALIRRVSHILQHSTDPAVMLATYFPNPGSSGWHITSTDITHTVKGAVQALGLARYNIPPDQVSSHSLRAGGAMALHLGGAPSHTIQLLGRWSSDTFMVYIHKQLSAFSDGLSTSMTRETFSHNVAIHPTLGHHRPPTA
jgi:integrase